MGRSSVAASVGNDPDYDFALARYTTTGALDISFGSGGKVTTPVSSVNDFANGVALQSDGKIVVAGFSYDTSISNLYKHIALLRYTSTGALDTSFGSGGKVTTSIGGYDGASSVALQSDGKIVVAGASYNGSNSDFALVRYTSTGALDISFGSGGKVTTSFGAYAYGGRLALQGDGKIVVTGGSYTPGLVPGFALARYTTTGTLDTSFGSGGKVTTAFGGSLYSYGMALQTDGKIVVAGYVVTDPDEYVHFALARYFGGELPLVFIPGIAGSELRSFGDQYWPSIDPISIGWLNLRTGFRNLVATDIVRTFGLPFYAPLVTHMIANGYTEFPIGGNPANMTDAVNFQTVAQSLAEKPTFFPFPYDWRYSNSTQTETLHRYITNIRQLHGGAKVNIVTHSMGGLLARRYLLDHPEDVPHIEHLITVGGPFWGAPKAIYNTLAGDFFGVLNGVVDFFNNAAMKATLPTLPGVHELFPSDHYLQNGGAPVMSEDRWNINNMGSASDVYTNSEYKALIDLKASPDTPSQTNDQFHNYQGGIQDDWSSDASGIKFLHICGRQNTNDTTFQVIAREETRTLGAFGAAVELRPRHFFEQLKGPGDGTVPLLSSERRSQYLAPGALVHTVPGPNAAVEHTALMGNAHVLATIDRFLANQPLLPPPAMLALPPPPSGTVATQRITIVGLNYVRVVDSLGNDNAKLSDMAARKVPGVAITYGGSEPWVDLSAESTVDLTIQGTAGDPPIEVTVVQLAQDGTALSLRRYRFDPAGHAWQGHIAPASAPSVTDPVVSVDANGNGTYEPGEQIPPTQTSGAGTPDITAPALGMTLSRSGEAILVSLTATDNVTLSPLIRYTIDDGPVQNYPGPLSAAAGQNVVLKAFAEDAMGNTSGLITTNVRPVLNPSSVGGAAIGLSWPVAEAYVLEEADDLAGPWTVSPAQISRSTFNESATVPFGTTPRKFFRLRAETVTK